MSRKRSESLCMYMVRSRKGIEMLVNLINISYSAMKILPYYEEAFSKYQKESAQEFRYALNKQIRQQIFYITFVQKSEKRIKSCIYQDVEAADSATVLLFIKVAKCCIS